MIRLTLAPEPAGFDAAVRQPGLRAIAEMVGVQPLVPRCGRRRQALWGRREDIPANKFPDYWTRTLDDLLREYQRLCAYMSCYIEKVTGMPSVDHMIPKSKAWDQVYEWKNYRLACLLMNARKNDLSTILDPCTIQNGWFELELADFQIKTRKAFGTKLRKRVEATLRILNQSDCCDLRWDYATDY